MAQRYWVGGSGTWDSITTTNWAASSGGAGGASVPTSADDVIFDANSNATAYDVTVSGIRSAKSVNFAAAPSSSGTITLTGSGGLTVSGNLTFLNGMVNTMTGLIKINNTSGTAVLTSNGVALDGSLSFAGAGGTFQLGDDCTVPNSGTTTLTIGTLQLNGKNLTTGLWSSNNSNTRTLDMSGGGTITVTGNATAVWGMTNLTGFTLVRGGSAICNYAGSTGTRTINHGSTTTGGGAGGSESNSMDFSISAGSDTVSIGNNSSTPNGGPHDLDFTGFSGLLTGPNPNLFIYGNVTLAAAMSVGSGLTLNWCATSGTKTIKSNGRTLSDALVFNGAGGTFQLLDTLSTGAGQATTLTAGTLDLAGQRLSTGTFSSSNSNTRTLTDSIGGGFLEITTTSAVTCFDTSTSANATIGTANPWSIKIDGSTANVRTFKGGGLSYSNFWYTNATSGGELDITGSNSFNVFKVDVGSQTIRFAANTTTTIATWVVAGTSGHLVTLNSLTSGTSFTLQAAASPATMSGNFLAIQDSVASPSGTWFAGHNSTNTSGNSGWSFTGGGFASDGTEAGSSADTLTAALLDVAGAIEAGVATDAPGGASVDVAAMVESGASSDVVEGVFNRQSDVSESGTSADVVGRILDAIGDASENGTASAVVDVALSALGDASESGVASETVTGLGAMVAGVSVAGVATDSPDSTVISSLASVVEVGVASDSIRGGLSAAGAASEAAAGADAVAGLIAAIGAASEAGNASSVAGATAILSASAAEAGAATDSPSSTMAFGTTVTEAGAIAATSGGSLVLVSDVAEAGAASGSVGAGFVVDGAASEAGAASVVVAAGYGPTGSAVDALAANAAQAAALALQGHESEAGAAADDVDGIPDGCTATLASKPHNNLQVTVR